MKTLANVERDRKRITSFVMSHEAFERARRYHVARWESRYRRMCSVFVGRYCRCHACAKCNVGQCAACMAKEIAGVSDHDTVRYPRVICPHMRESSNEGVGFRLSIFNSSVLLTYSYHQVVESFAQLVTVTLLSYDFASVSPVSLPRDSGSWWSTPLLASGSVQKHICSVDELVHTWKGIFRDFNPCVPSSLPERPDSNFIRF